MGLSGLAAIAAFLVIYSTIAKRLDGTSITAPMLFVVFGFIAGERGLGIVTLAPDNEMLQILAEITLTLILFADAARIDINVLREEQGLPIRMLTIGLGLVILCGTGIGLLLTSFTLWEAAILAAILTPTDAALAQTVVSSPIVPQRVRQAINAESGLNDGVALPILILFLALAGVSIETETTLDVARFALLQLTLGPIVGVAIGYTGGQLVLWSEKNNMMKNDYLHLSTLGLAVVAFAMAELIGGNGFIAAFVAGLTIGATAQEISPRLHEFAETEGEILVMLTFIIFGAVLLPMAFAEWNTSVLVYALLSLTLVRMLPIALSLIGTGLRWQTVMLFGWFGPRGIASIIYLLIVVHDSTLPDLNPIMQITATTIGLSVLLHGLSAAPLSRWYQSQIPHANDDDNDNQPDI